MVVLLLQYSEGASVVEEAGQATKQTDPTEEPAFKRFRYLSNIVSEKLREASSCPNSPQFIPGQDELEKYLQDEVRLHEDSEPLHYWRDNELKYPVLSALASDLLVIPASNAPVERVFSTSGQTSCGKRNQLTATNLEREVMVKKNKCYLQL